MTQENHMSQHRGESPDIESTILVTDLRLSPTSRNGPDRGLLGYVSFLLNGAFRVDCVTLRETRDGRMTLSFPMRKDRSGREHSIFFPVTDEARVAIETQVFDAIAELMNPKTRSPRGCRAGNA